MLTKGEIALKNALMNDADAFESNFDGDFADAPAITKTPNASQLGAVAGNPVFTAQFDIQILIKYYTLNAGTYTEIAASALNAALKNQLAFYLFAQSDFQSGYPNIATYLPLNTNWTASLVGIWKKDDFASLAFDANVTANLNNGDCVLCFTSALPGGGTTTLATVIIRCSQVAYGTLLQSLSSDRFVMNMIRYVIPLTSYETQYANNIGIIKQSLFGKGSSDWISPNSFKRPEQQQTGIIDIPLKKGIDKQIGLASYVNYDAVDFSLSLYVWRTQKLQA